ncbi:MAG: ribokinase [Ktedonobacterales bacterium]
MANTGGGVVIVASFVLDMVTHVPRRPRAGESLIGSDFGMFVGGKGCNQAIAAARAGADVRVIGRLGADVFAEQFRTALAREGIGTRWVIVDDLEGTGVAFPMIEPDGQNSIVVVPRANLRLTGEDILTGEAAFDGAHTLLVQMEVGQAAVWKAIELANQRGMSVLFNPAPVPDPPPSFPAELWHHIDFLLPNEREVEALTGLPAQNIPETERAARVLIERGCRSVVVTLGSRGALWIPGAAEPAVILPPFTVQQVDATAAGDAFCGVLAASLAAGQQTLSALRRASAAGALATTRRGAEPSLPRTAEIDSLLGV